MSVEVRLPRLLQKSLFTGSTQLSEQCRLHPTKLSPTLNYDTLSNASMTLSEYEPILRQHDFVELFGVNGSLGIFWVVDRKRKYGKSITYSLNHAFDVFNAAVIPGVDTISGTVAQVLAHILQYQKVKVGGVNCWQLGTVECNKTYSFENAYDKASERLNNIADEFDEYYFTFSFATFPWTLNFVKKSNAELSELRLNKNIDGIEVTESDNEQCNRLYLSIDSQTDDSVPEEDQGVIYRTVEDSASIAEWGVIEDSLGIDTEDVPDVDAFVARFFRQHAQPEIQIQITGEDYRQYTGESIDEMFLGFICRTILAEYNTIFRERIVSINYPDILRNPTHFTVSLANKRKSAGGSIAKEKQKNEKTARKGRGGRKKQAQQNKEFWTEFNRTDRYIELVAKHADDNGTILEQAGMYLDVDNVLQYVDDYVNYPNAIGSKVHLQADKVAMVVGTYQDGTNYVKAGEIALAINATDGESIAKINANHVQVVGGQTAQTILGHMEVESYYDQGQLKSRLVVKTDAGMQLERVEGGVTSRFGVYDNGNLTGGIMVQEINGQSKTYIAGNKILIGSKTATVQINGLLDAVEGIRTVDLEAVNGRITNLMTGQAAASVLLTGELNATSSIACPSIWCRGSDLANAFVSLTDPGYSNNQKIVTFTKANGETQKVTFSRATTLTGEWSGRRFKVTASPQGAEKSGYVYDSIVQGGTATHETSGSNHFVKRKFVVYSDDGGGNAGSKILENELNVPANTVWDDAWDGCYNNIGIDPSTSRSIGFAGESGGSITVKVTAKDKAGNVQNPASVTITGPSRPSVSHNITGFVTTSPSWSSSSSGRGATIHMVVNGSWQCDGVARSGQDWLEAKPGEIYRTGWDRGANNVKSNLHLISSSKERLKWWSGSPLQGGAYKYWYWSDSKL